MSLLLLAVLHLVTPVLAEDSPAKSAEQMSEVDYFYQAMGRAYKIGKGRIVDRNQPKPPKDIYDDNNPNHIPFPFAGKKVLRIDGELLGLCMALVTKAPFEFGKEKTTCKAINITGNALAKNEKRSTSFLSYLAAEKERACDYTSGNEADLNAWIMAQPDNSIDPVGIYQKSLELNAGNLWNAILTIHQLLRNNARWLIGDHYDYDSTVKKQGQFFNKFIDIRGDLEQRGAGFHGDHFGSWYRLWGAMLYRLNLIKTEDFTAGMARATACFTDKLKDTPGFASRAISGLVKDWHSEAIFYSEEYLKLHLYESEDDARKYDVDKGGGNAASSLVRGVWDPGLPAENGLTLEKCLAHPYLIEE